MKPSKEQGQLAAALGKIDVEIDELNNSGMEEGLLRGKLIELKQKREKIQEALNKAASSS